MMEIPIPMPGSFSPDVEHTVRPTLTKANARPSIFLPPQSPSASSSLSQSFYSTPRTLSNTIHGCRKRVRLDQPSLFSRHPQQTAQDDEDDIMASFNSAQSPAPLVNTSYRLSGGLDTPTATSHYDEKEDLEDLDHRPRRFTSQARMYTNEYFPQTPDALSRERNGQKRAPSSPQHQGWGKAVCYRVGEVAGKVFNFCWTGAFRGFHAGGGVGYDVDAATPVVVEQSSWADIKDKEDVFSEQYQRQHYRDSTPVPGEFPGENFIEDYMSRPQHHQTEALIPPLQQDHRRINGGGYSLKENWVIVKAPGADSRESSPTRSVRKVPRTSTPSQDRPLSSGLTSARPRLAPSRPSRSSFAGPAGLASDQPASFASIRRPGTQSGPQTSEIRQHRRSQSSVVSPRRSRSVRDSPAAVASPDVQKFQKKLRQKERFADDSIHRLNQQTKDMIREAREALGTRIDIDDGDEIEDEGYGEGTDLMGESKWK